MNYQFQFPGVDTNCDRTGDNVLDYSTGARAAQRGRTARGRHLQRRHRLNGNAVIDAGPIAGTSTRTASPPGARRPRRLGHISLTAVNNGASPDGRTAPEIIDEQPVPLPGR
jgi:hypothetical protein